MENFKNRKDDILHFRRQTLDSFQGLCILEYVNITENYGGQSLNDDIQNV